MIHLYQAGKIIRTTSVAFLLVYEYSIMYDEQYMEKEDLHNVYLSLLMIWYLGGD